MKSDLGRLGEQDALEFLISKKGYRFIDRNYRTRWGELDLIVEDVLGTLVFVEVKARIQSQAGSALEQIDLAKLGHLKRAISSYLDGKNWQERSCRLDAVGIEYRHFYEGGHDSWRVVAIDHVSDLTGW